MHITFCLGLIFLMASPIAIAREGAAKSPEQLSKQLRTSYKKVKRSCVAISCDGSASGVIISQNGLVLTAAHVLERIGEDVKITITLEDGTNYLATKLGYNLETDLGLLLIDNPRNSPLPVCRLAKTASNLGEYIFTYAHPSGAIAGRPAQLRLGRVLSIKMLEAKPLYIFSDLNIQPGDSGGPLFNLDGELVGINSSAAEHIGFNIFGTIDQFYKDAEKLSQKEILGDAKNAPMNGSYLRADFSQEILVEVQAEIMRRAKMNHYKTVDFIRKHINEEGRSVLDANDLVNLSAVDSIALANGQEVVLGLDDPSIIKLLPKQKPLHFYTYKIKGVNKTNSESTGEQQPSREIKAVALEENLLLVKASIFSQLDSTYLMLNDKRLSISEQNVVRKSKHLDLILLKIEGLNAPETIQFSKSTVITGQALMAPDRYSRPVWNIATDRSREVRINRSIGPIENKQLISKRRSPYPLSIRHALPLFAADAGTPVFDLKGNFIGIHIARFSRTLGLILPEELIGNFYKEYLTERD